MASPQHTPSAGSFPTQGLGAPKVLKVPKGELLFAEGENSRAMYLLKSGMVRLFKRKGDAVIELDTVHAGQVLGELAFLDGNPRSASGEALIECDLVEISGPAFVQTLTMMPEWVKILLKTVVGRLRNASTRIRQLETSSSAVDYSDKSGKRNSNYVYLSAGDVLKGLSALLLVTARAPELKVELYHRYGNQIMGVPVAKLTSLTELLTQIGILGSEEGGTGAIVLLKDQEFLEKFIQYLNQENLCEPGKRHDLPPRSFLLMSLMQKHLARFPRNEETGMVEVNLATIQELERKDGKDLFKLDDFTSLASLGYGTVLNHKSGTEILTSVNAGHFTLAYRLQRIVIGIQAINEQKRKQNAGIK